jgi:hypothetical protein
MVIFGGEFSLIPYRRPQASYGRPSGAARPCGVRATEACSGGAFLAEIPNWVSEG